MPDLIDRFLNHRSDTDVIYIYSDNPVTVGDIVSQIWSTAHDIQALELTSNSRVLLSQSDGIRWISTFWALIILGHEIVIAAPDTDPKIISDISVQHRIEFVFDDHIKITCVGCSDPIIPYRYQDSDTILNFMTSGTTGSPGIVSHSLGNLLAFPPLASSFARTLGIEPNSTVLCSARMNFSWGFCVNVLMPWLLKTQHIIGLTTMEYRDLDSVCDRRNIDHLIVNPYLLDIIGKTTRSRQKSIFRSVTVGGEPLPPVLSERYREKFGVLNNAYGLTETLFTVLICDQGKDFSIGRPLEDIEIKVVDEQKRDCGNAPGCLAIKTSTAFVGYLNSPEKSSEVLRDGWVYTNDVVSLDTDGNVIFHGRQGSFFKNKGKWVSLIDIENIFLSYSGINDCLVTGYYDHDGSISLDIEIISDHKIPEDDIQNFYYLHRPDRHIKIKNIKFVNNILRTSNMKKIRTKSKDR